MSAQSKTVGALARVEQMGERTFHVVRLELCIRRAQERKELQHMRARAHI
jgi:hypothetical protein